MTYFADLSDYSYLGNNEPLIPKPLNIGWLEKPQLFSISNPNNEFVHKLLEFCKDKYIVNQMLGFQICDYCNEEIQNSWYQLNLNKYGEQTECCSLGNGEIRVIGKNKIYAAPSLIYHYVNEHHYKPPDEFIEAVLSGPKPGSEDHLRIFTKYT